VSSRETLLAIATNGLASALGIELKEVSEQRVVATMPVDATTRQPFGVLHGGASVVLAETAASVGACALIDLDQFQAVGLEINANHLRTKTSGIVTAIATPTHVGKQVQVWSIEIRGEDGKLVCVSRCTLMIVPRRQ
jgi:uncharacterized protein (TIGR00369 family)